MARVQQIGSAVSPFFEPQLDEYLKEAISSGALSVSSHASKIPELVFLTVATPRNIDGSINLAQINAAATAIGRCIRDFDGDQLVCVKSTVVPGTTRNLVKEALERASRKLCGRDFGLCYNPEFLREGSAIKDTEFPDRIIIGGDDHAAITKLEGFYRRVYETNTPPVIRTSFENAELTKYANNVFLAMKVSFINCMANIAERLPHADVKSVAEGIGIDARIGSQFLNAGLGWGGSCFPKDLDALVRFSFDLGYDSELIKSVINTNKYQYRSALRFAENGLRSLRGKNIAILGLAFKPDTDDISNAVSIPLIQDLLRDEANVIAYDPMAQENARRVFHNAISYASTALECISEADCCIIVTEWTEFKNIKPDAFLDKMRNPLVIDGRRIYNEKEFRESGIKFRAVGLGPKEG
jgi:UDPglucose 6-dehydrogenase